MEPADGGENEVRGKDRGLLFNVDWHDQFAKREGIVKYLWKLEVFLVLNSKRQAGAREEWKKRERDRDSCCGVVQRQLETL